MKKVLILILAYNAQNHIAGVIDRIPKELWSNPDYTTDVVIIDDCSKDNTSAVARVHLNQFPYPVRLLCNSLNQGYGGNQKIGYIYAIEHGYDIVVMVHGDGQYPPEKLPDMIAPLVREEADAVFGSRMMHKKDALAGHMPLYKFAGNIALTALQNLMLGAHLSEFHTGFRAYSVATLKRIPFQHNSNVFHFDTDIIIQLVDNGMKIIEIPIPTYYGDEICHVNGIRYAFDVMVSTFLSRIQKYGIFYAPKFDYEPALFYPDKSSFASSHSFALAQVPGKERVLDIGCGEGYVSSRLRANGSTVAGCDWRVDDKMRACYDKVFATDLNYPDFSVLNSEHFDVIMLLDVIEHLLSPERFMTLMHAWCANDNPRIILTTPNIAFCVPRFMLMLGQFNYGKRGTLDMTHTRLFTFGSLKRLLASTGFNAVEVHGIPAPFPLAVGSNWVARCLLKLNIFLIKISKSLFSYQIAVVARPAPTLEMLMRQAIEVGDAVK
jgi:glycosyltransferase involved in cell wall biosynthesis